MYLAVHGQPFFSQSLARSIVWHEHADLCQCYESGDCLYRIDDTWNGPGASEEGYYDCPGVLIRTPEAAELARWHRYSQVAPLADWPYSYPVWLVDALAELQSALSERQSQEFERNAKLRTGGF